MSEHNARYAAATSLQEADRHVGDRDTKQDQALSNIQAVPPASTAPRSPTGHRKSRLPPLSAGTRPGEGVPLAATIGKSPDEILATTRRAAEVDRLLGMEPSELDTEAEAEARAAVSATKLAASASRGEHAGAALGAPDSVPLQATSPKPGSGMVSGSPRSGVKSPTATASVASGLQGDRLPSPMGSAGRSYSFRVGEVSPMRRSDRSAPSQAHPRGDTRGPTPHGAMVTREEQGVVAGTGIA